MEKFLFRKIELWVLLLVATLLVAAGLFFGHVLYAHLVDGTVPPRLGRNAVALAALPTRFVNEIEHMRFGLPVAERRFEDANGFDFFYEPGTGTDYGYLLLSRRDGDLRRSVVELVDLDTQQVRHRWVMEPEVWWRDDTLGTWPEEHRVRNFSHVFRAMHPLLKADGTLVVKGSGGPMLGLDGCAMPVWVNTDANFHHSTEEDSHGRIWAPVFLSRGQIRRLDVRYSNEGLAAVSSDGSELEELLAVETILVNNGLAHVVNGRGPARPYSLHLNDVQPVMEDGLLWRRGDLLLSLRDQSMVLLYRPSSGEVIWKQEGYWRHQHDVDVHDAHTLSIFDNNTLLLKGPDERSRVEGLNHLYAVRFPGARPELLMNSGFIWNEIRTPLEGLADWVTLDRLMVEETRHGRILQMDEQGGMDWQFVNRASDGIVRFLNWSRHVPRALGDAALAHLLEQDCG